MTPTTSAPVLIAVDGSPGAMRAVRLGTTEAALRDRPVRLFHVVAWPTYPSLPPYPQVYDTWEERMLQAGREVLRKAQALVTEVAPDVTVTQDIRLGSPSWAIINASTDAELLVVGDRGAGGFDRLLVGSVATQVTAHADCTVLVARPRKPEKSPGNPVLVGVKGADSDKAVLDFAFSEASLRGVGLTAVHVWRGPLTNGPRDMLPPVIYETEDVADAEKRLLSEALSGYAERYPDVPIKAFTVRGRPARILLDYSLDADLVVVGPWGWRGAAGRLLGSVCQAVLHGAHCPVAVVR